MKKNKENLKEILELGKKLFEISQFQEENSTQHTHPHGHGTNLWLSYSEGNLHVVNDYINLELSNKKQGPYQITVDWEPKKSMDASETRVFECYFNGAPNLKKWLKDKYLEQKPEFKEKKFCVVEEKLGDLTYKKGDWTKKIDEIYHRIKR